MKCGLVLEGGAMRGLFTTGAIDVLMENGVEFDGVIGVSAGACFGCNYISQQSGRALRYNLRFCNDPRYSGWKTLLRTGDIFGAEFCYRTIPEQLDLFDYEAFERNPTPFYVVCTDVETGEAIYHIMPHARGAEMDWLRASASMPMVSRIVKVNGRKLLDGGVADSIPLRFFEQEGYARNLVILTQPRDYVKPPNSMLPLAKIMLRKYPKMIQTMARRHEIYNESTQYVHQRAQEGAALVLQPKAPLDIGRIEHDPEKLRKAYELGREAALERLEEINAFLAKQHAQT